MRDNDVNVDDVLTHIEVFYHAVTVTNFFFCIFFISLRCSIASVVVVIIAITNKIKTTTAAK